MIRILFLEGPRASGKTTVADAFVKLGWERVKVHRTSKPGEAFKDQEKMLLEYILHPEKKYIVDRFHLTELIMTKYTGRDDPLEAEIGARLIHNQILRIKDAAVIILLPPESILEERMAKSTKQINMPIHKAHHDWNLLSYHFDVPKFYFADLESVDIFAKTVDKVENNG